MASNFHEIPPNTVAAYGIQTALSQDVVLKAYQLLSFNPDAGLDAATAQSLNGALTYLSKVFPEATLPNAYGSGKRLLNELNMFFREMVSTEDSPVREELQAYAKGRLYSSSLKGRASDLIADKSFRSIANEDPTTFAQYVKDPKIVINGIAGIESEVTGAMMLGSARPLKDLERSVISRNKFTEKIVDMAKDIAPFVVQSPWSHSADRGCWVNDVGITIGTPSAALGFQHLQVLGYAAFGSQADYERIIADTATARIADSHMNEIYADGMEGESGCGYVVRGAAAQPLAPLVLHQATTIQRAGDDIFGSLFISSSVTANQYVAFNFEVTAGGVTVNTQITPTGSSANTIAIGNANLHYHEVLTAGNTAAQMTFSIVGAPVGALAIRVYRTLALAASEVNSAFITVTPPIAIADDAVMSDIARVNGVRDMGFVHWMSNFLDIQAELQSVGEDQFLKPYHVYLFGPDANYTTTNALDALQVSSIKSLLLQPNAWSNIHNLAGLLEKLYSDLWSLLALAQSTDPA